jgi:AmmeMemoRadiSam system protein A
VRKRLLESARAAVAASVRGEAPFVPVITEEDRLDRRGVFVSLHIDDDLRGCIGYIESDRPLVETVVSCAVAAATADTRFPRLTLEELSRVAFEISLLSPPRAVAGSSEIVIGRDGVIVTASGRKALLLPQVATRQGWSVEEFLGAACRKVGLPSSAWRWPGARIEVFTAEVFAEATGA